MSKHHSHEISEHPEVQWALELLKPDPTYELSVLQRYASEILCVGSGFGIVALKNFFSPRKDSAREIDIAQAPAI